MNKILLIVLLTYGKVWATGQASDFLIWQDEVLPLFSNPLESNLNISSIRVKMFENKKPSLLTSCWRGYVAYWSIIEDQLYLTDIQSCTYFQDSLKADLSKIFPNEFENGRVKATWVNEKIFVQKGKELYYIHDGYQRIYEKEVEIELHHGKLISVREYDNSKTRQSIFTKETETLRRFIYSNINWTIIPTTLEKGTERVLLNLVSGSEPQPEKIRVLLSHNDILKDEALRVIRLLPEWDVFYKRGEPYRVSYMVPIVFNEANRKKYSK